MLILYFSKTLILLIFLKINEWGFYLKLVRRRKLIDLLKRTLLMKRIDRLLIKSLINYIIKVGLNK